MVSVSGDDFQAFQLSAQREVGVLKPNAEPSIFRIDPHNLDPGEVYVLQRGNCVQGTRACACGRCRGQGHAAGSVTQRPPHFISGRLWAGHRAPLPLQIRPVQRNGAGVDLPEAPLARACLCRRSSGRGAVAWWVWVGVHGVGGGPGDC